MVLNGNIERHPKCVLKKSGRLSWESARHQAVQSPGTQGGAGLCDPAGARAEKETDGYLELTEQSVCLSV